MIKKQFVITIGRQYGSGGRLVGKRLAEDLGIHFYDDDILKLTSEKTAIGEQYFRMADEKAVRSEAGHRKAEYPGEHRLSGEPVPLPGRGDP